MDDDCGSSANSLSFTDSVSFRNVQITLQILAALIEKAPRDLPLYSPYVLRILSIILRSRDITMVESSIPTWDAFCEHHDMASLSADQEYLHQYEDIVRMYASFASTRDLPSKIPDSAPVAIRWRNAGLNAVKSVSSSDALATVAGRQLDVIVPILLENLWTDNEDFLDVLQSRAELEEKVDSERLLLRRRTSVATVRTAGTSDTNAAVLSRTTADADKMAEENIGVLALQCLKEIFVVNNRSQLRGATAATLKFVTDRVAQGEVLVDKSPNEKCQGWAPKIFDMITRWTPVQDRYVILVTAMDTLVRSPLLEADMQRQLVLATMVDGLLKSDIMLIGLSVMDVLLGLIQHVLRILQLSGVGPHMQQSSSTDDVKNVPESSTPTGVVTEIVSSPTNARMDLLDRLQQCMGDLATHVYYADQISDMVTAILLRLKPSPLSSIPNTAAAIANPDATTAALASGTEITEDLNTDGFFSFDTAKIKALEAIKNILLVASHNTMTGAGSLGRHRVPVKVWEGTQWLLRDSNGSVRKAYVDALLTWLDREVTKSDLRIVEEKPKGLSRTNRDESSTNLAKRAVSNSSQKEKLPKTSQTTFLQLLHLAVYENALQYLDSEADIVLLHLLLSELVDNLGVNAVKCGLPMIFRLQEDILEAETPTAKIRMGSLCHGYFWTLSEKFAFEGSPIGRAIQNEVVRRQKKMFWIEKIRLPPLNLDHIGTPGRTTPQQPLPIHELESESLRPFDGRFQMVKLISLSYAQSIASPPSSPPASPNRSFSHPFSNSDPPSIIDNTMPEKIKDQMMSEWSKEAVIASAQEGSKTVSINGSRSGTTGTGHLNFLAVNGNFKNGDTGSGTQSPQHAPRNVSASAYGLIGGMGALQKLRKGSGQSPSPASESSRNSVTRVDQLKRVLSGQQNSLPGTRGGVAHSDASSESMVSYDFTASEVSYNPSAQQQNIPPMEQSVSLRDPSVERTRSKSRDRLPNDISRSLNSHPANKIELSNILAEERECEDDVPPVPPLPLSMTGDSAVHDYGGNGKGEEYRKGRSLKSRGGTAVGKGTSWGIGNGTVKDLQDLLKEIEVGGGGSGDEGKLGGGKPPY